MLLLLSDIGKEWVGQFIEKEIHARRVFERPNETAAAVSVLIIVVASLVEGLSLAYISCVYPTISAFAINIGYNQLRKGYGVSFDGSEGRFETPNYEHYSSTFTLHFPTMDIIVLSISAVVYLSTCEFIWRVLVNRSSIAIEYRQGRSRVASGRFSVPVSEAGAHSRGLLTGRKDDSFFSVVLRKELGINASQSPIINSAYIILFAVCFFLYFYPLVMTHYKVSCVDEKHVLNFLLDFYDCREVVFG